MCLFTCQYIWCDHPMWWYGGVHNVKFHHMISCCLNMLATSYGKGTVVIHNYCQFKQKIIFTVETLHKGHLGESEQSGHCVKGGGGGGRGVWHLLFNFYLVFIFLKKAVNVGYKCITKSKYASIKQKPKIDAQKKKKMSCPQYRSSFMTFYSKKLGFVAVVKRLTY